MRGDPILAAIGPAQADELLTLHRAIHAHGAVPCDGDDRFTLEGPARTKAIRDAAALCGTCPVLDQCLAYGLRYPHEAGLYGGLTPTERHYQTRDKEKAA